jgi:hypothetical protein
VVGREDLQPSSSGSPSQPFSSLWPRGYEVARFAGSTSPPVRLAIHAAFFEIPRSLLRLVDDKLGHHSLFTVLLPGYPTHFTRTKVAILFVLFCVAEGSFVLVYASKHRYPPQQALSLREEIPRQRVVSGWKRNMASQLRRWWHCGLISHAGFIDHVDTVVSRACSAEHCPVESRTRKPLLA